jgi:D-hexose-6-phosphate mutarotase
MRAHELTAEFGIAGVLDFIETEHGLVKATISLGDTAGELYLQGAQVTAWQPQGNRPVLFTSPNAVFQPGKAIRGGIPIVFPWFGPHRHAPAAPQHGFARTATWHLDAVETAGTESLTLTLSLGDADVRSPLWPEPFRATYTVTFARTLSLSLAVQNRATHPITFEEALHNYFAVSDVTAVAISGVAGTAYIDKTEAGRREWQTESVVTIAAETDRVYLDTPPRCVIEDHGSRRYVVVEKVGAASIVVWNPWAEKGAAMADLGALAAERAQHGPAFLVLACRPTAICQIAPAGQRRGRRLPGLTGPRPRSLPQAHRWRVDRHARQSDFVRADRRRRILAACALGHKACRENRSVLG